MKHYIATKIKDNEINISARLIQLTDFVLCFLKKANLFSKHQRFTFENSMCFFIRLIYMHHRRANASSTCIFGRDERHRFLFLNY